MKLSIFSEKSNTTAIAKINDIDVVVSAVNFKWIGGSISMDESESVLKSVQVAINSNDTSDNDTISNSLTAWGADGFTVNGNGATGANGDTYVDLKY